MEDSQRSGYHDTLVAGLRGKRQTGPEDNMEELAVLAGIQPEVARDTQVDPVQDMVEPVLPWLSTFYV